MNQVFSFVVYGKPEPAGSKRGFAFKRRNGSTGASVVDANPKAQGWKTLVGLAVQEAYKGELLSGPLQLELRFFAPRIKGHLRSNGQVKDSAPPFPTSRPDVLKLARGVEDSLTGIIWRDDAQIVREILSKNYGSPARVEIKVTVLSVFSLAAQADGGQAELWDRR